MRTPRCLLHRCVFVLLVCAAASAARAAGSPPRLRLVLQLTVDQLRADLPHRYYDRLSRNGFRRFYERGVAYENAHYTHAFTVTLAGHSTLATGADPAGHGMIGNGWYDRAQRKVVSGVSDDRYPLLVKDAQSGRAPTKLLCTTFSDELAKFTAGRSRIFAVSTKDRGAIPLAGETGKAFWFHGATRGYVTSRYYYEETPEWVVAWNNKRLVDSYAGTHWELLHDRSTYLFGSADDVPWEPDVKGFGRTFPHPYPERDDETLAFKVAGTPAGDELLLDFAKTLIEAEALGQGPVPDYLAISFSSTDSVGHRFGPSSLEAEDNLLRLDRVLGELFAYLDHRFGRSRVLVVLSADHGVMDAPGYLVNQGFQARTYSEADLLAGLDADLLQRRFGVGTNLVEDLGTYVYLNKALMRERGLDAREVESVLAAEFEKQDIIFQAVSLSRLRAGGYVMNPLLERIRRHDVPSRSGDLYLVLAKNTVGTAAYPEVAATHGTPWRHDTHVPILFTGAGLRPRRVFREVAPVDVAPTLAALLGVNPPSASVGQPLAEVTEQLARKPGGFR